ncbi:acireductone synthase [Pseudoroseomonas wenyumeiae]|uniref:Enolase-phosphatase E1 n=1 Tax=Teichococcus wenyumeiae TaxID=2478470 RepID=A0A3A9JYX4_9PROT|nr:acireductone synthase [Pseudoroseomonas wenyumeiae]RKK04309.1 acireductone synthase [Pseudoroseomonas wenyumeiae]RMI26591.1 acireductone synthase [Pseudoroseomonas wenyumeiae]
MAPVSAVLTDIEGTTSSIAFVKETLFPFAREALEGFLADHGQEPEVAACLAEARRLAEPGEDGVSALRRWMAEDAKVTPLKTLQGLIWRQGYLDGRIEGHLWPDVAPCLRAWARAGIGLHVYSSGSVAAQKLIFGHSAAGDLASLFTGFFDTTTGGKREAASYAAIARGLHLPPESILFLSDVAEELDAAATAGFQTCQLVREADGTLPSGRHRQAADFPGVARQFGLPLPRATAA